MAAFKLPRLKANLPLVNGQGKPLDYYLRFWNIEVAPRIEQQEADQNELIAQIQAVQQEQADQLALIIAAQARADEAYALAQDANGAKYVEINSDAPATFADKTVNGVEPSSLLQFNGRLEGGSIDANSDWTGKIMIYEGDGITFDILASIDVTVSPTGLIDPGEYSASNSTSAIFMGIGTRSGTVVYRVNYAQTGPVSYIDLPNIRSTLIITPAS